jgi:hypothetical protein
MPQTNQRDCKIKGTSLERMNITWVYRLLSNQRSVHSVLAAGPAPPVLGGRWLGRLVRSARARVDSWRPSILLPTRSLARWACSYLLCLAPGLHALECGPCSLPLPSPAPGFCFAFSVFPCRLVIDYSWCPERITDTVINSGALLPIKVTYSFLQQVRSMDEAMKGC